ncbi:unnamed protein product [Calicophoron daubneyi]|uniref:Bystin n=1 Tax=Calicophoron daubneyi TaxID=300641 RepID=A0AAV2TVZ2_CALDB
MPKRKMKRSSEGEANILGGRDVHKLQKLMREIATESDIKSEPKVRQQEDDEEDADVPSDVEDITIPANDVETTEEDQEEWKKFFRYSDDEEYVAELQKNLQEAKIKIAEEASQYTGSLPGDLDEFRGVDDFAELPEELRNHIGLLLDVLKHYRSGPLPKTVKMLPHLPGWEGLLELLKPLEWTPHAYPRIVKVFASKGHEPALHFYENYLLPKVKEDIEENRRLSVQLFEALIASMFRPEEFVSGVFLPWVQSDMSKTEGVILSHLMKKASLRVRFGAVALALILDEEFSVPRSMVIEALLSKHYYMPEAALERVIHYFLSFDKDCSAYFTTENRMPVTWFRSLLIFLESYRGCLKPEDRNNIIKLCRRHEHPQITPDIRKLLALVPSN